MIKKIGPLIVLMILSACDGAKDKKEMPKDLKSGKVKLEQEIGLKELEHIIFLREE